MMILSIELTNQVSNNWNNDISHTKNGPAHTLSLIFSMLGWTKRQNSWICDRENDIPFNFLHPSYSYAQQEIQRSMNLQLTKKNTISKKSL